MQAGAVGRGEHGGLLLPHPPSGPMGSLVIACSPCLPQTPSSPTWGLCWSLDWDVSVTPAGLPMPALCHPSC